MREEQKAFMESFKDTHDQYQITDDEITDYLQGNTREYFSGYTELADARNLWRDALRFADYWKKDEAKTREELIDFLTGHRLGHELSSEDAMRAFIKDVVECGFAHGDWKPFKKGDWFMGTKIVDDDLWGQIERGEITGYSMGGDGIRITRDLPARSAA